MKTVVMRGAARSVPPMSFLVELHQTVEITQSILRFTNNKHLLPVSFLRWNNDHDRRIEDTVNCYFFMSFLWVRKSSGLSERIHLCLLLNHFFFFYLFKRRMLTQDVISNTNETSMDNIHGRLFMKHATIWYSSIRMRILEWQNILDFIF